MPRPSSNYVSHGLWDCHKKIKSRDEVIIKNYKQYFNNSIPKNKQYWTMSGSYFNENNEPLHGELGQLLDNNLITENQFYAVDIQDEIIQKNKHHYPNTNWITGDFLETIKHYYFINNFNPEIINFDNVMQKNFGVEYLKDILVFLDDCYNGSLLLLCNFCLNNSYKKSYIVNTGEEIFNALIEIYRFPLHWSVKKDYYQYNGSGAKSKTVMGMFVFKKDKHEKMEYGDTNIFE